MVFFSFRLVLISFSKLFYHSFHLILSTPTLQNPQKNPTRFNESVMYYRYYIYIYIYYIIYIQYITYIYNIYIIYYIYYTYILIIYVICIIYICNIYIYICIYILDVKRGVKACKKRKFLD